jgi:hypothetical protein
VETDGVGILAEAAAANVESVLADDPEAGGADTALSRALAIAFGVRAPDVRVTHCSKTRGVWKRTVFLAITSHDVSDNCEHWIVANIAIGSRPSFARRGRRRR